MPVTVTNFEKKMIDKVSICARFLLERLIKKTKIFPLCHNNNSYIKKYKKLIPYSFKNEILIQKLKNSNY